MKINRNNWHLICANNRYTVTCDIESKLSGFQFKVWVNNSLAHEKKATTGNGLCGVYHIPIENTSALIQLNVSPPEVNLRNTFWMMKHLGQAHLYYELTVNGEIVPVDSDFRVADDDQASSGQEVGAENDQEALKILKKRLALGEISEDEFTRLKLLL